MAFSDIKDRLARLETDKLIDISKNYKQYGYDNETINYVMSLLNERGVPVQDLWLTGNLSNSHYERAVRVFETFKKNSATALFLYLIILIIKLSFIVHFAAWESYPALYIALYYTFAAAYLVFLVKSFFNQSELFKLAGDDYGTAGIFIYLLGGISFYLITYFFFLKQMKEKMALIK